MLCMKAKAKIYSYGKCCKCVRREFCIYEHSVSSTAGFDRSGYSAFWIFYYVPLTFLSKIRHNISM